jgi:hypothetical protein
LLSKVRQRGRSKPLGIKRSGQSAERLLSVRSALVFDLALQAGIGAAFLLHAAHRSSAEIVIGALVTIGAALKLIDHVIGLRR